MSRIVDASVVVKWLVPEEGCRRAAEVMEGILVAPDCLVPECLNGLRKKVLRGEIRLERAMAAAHLLAKSGITFESTQGLAADILALSLRLSLPTYDCAYLALAASTDGILITADQRLIARCRLPDATDLASRVISLFDEAPPRVQERPARPYIPRRKAA